MIGPDGVARIELAPTTTSGRVNMRFALAGNHEKELHPWLEANARDWVLVGLTGGTLLHSSVSEHTESLVPGSASRTATTSTAAPPCSRRAASRARGC